jgi:hypothetical protein
MRRAWPLQDATLAALAIVLAIVSLVVAGEADAQPSAVVAATGAPGGPLLRANDTPFPSSSAIVSARWLSGRYDPPSNQWGDILPTVWSEDGSTYVMMDDGGVDPPKRGGIWRQSLARITGPPPALRFTHVGNPFAPAPRTWSEIGGDHDRDDGPLGPYYSIGFTEAGGVFYATQQRDWNWGSNAGFTGLAGIAYSTNRGRTWRFANKSFPAPLGNLTFVLADGKGRGPAQDGYLYAIGTEREFNASQMILGRVRPGVANVTDPARWQWFARPQSGVAGAAPAWSPSLTSAVPVMSWNQHVTYPQMTYDAPLHRYLLTFTYSYSSNVPAVWRSGAELVILESPTPWGGFSFVARSRMFGPSNGYGAGFPGQWISADGRTLWLKWAANFDGCAPRMDCTGKYGFNVAKVGLTLAPKVQAKPASHRKYIAAVALLPLLLLLPTRKRLRANAGELLGRLSGH